MVFRDIREHLRDIFGSFSGNTFIYHEAGVILDPFGNSRQFSSLKSCSEDVMKSAFKIILSAHF